MEGRINYDGSLAIKRGSTFKNQECRFENMPCSDTCPLFGEPRAEIKLSTMNDNFGWHETGKTELRICSNTTLIFDKFEDKRW